MYRVVQVPQLRRRRDAPSSSESDSSDSTSSSDGERHFKVVPINKKTIQDHKKNKSNQKSTNFPKTQPPPPGYVNFPVPSSLLNQRNPVTYTVTIAPADQEDKQQPMPLRLQEPTRFPQGPIFPSDYGNFGYDNGPGGFIPVYYPVPMAGYPQTQQQPAGADVVVQQGAPVSTKAQAIPTVQTQPQPSTQPQTTQVQTQDPAFAQARLAYVPAFQTQATPFIIFPDGRY